MTGYRWTDSQTLELTFVPQTVLGEYRLTLGPQILDLGGNPLDQDNDGVPGERTDDQFKTTFALSWSGTLAQDTTWTADQGPILVSGAFVVPADMTLTIGPGTTVKFASGAGITVNGTLRVSGTATQPVVLTSSRDDSMGGDTNGDGNGTSPSPGNWRGLKVAGTGLIDLKDFQIRYATTAIDANSTGAKATLADGSIIKSSQYGIYVYSPYVEITGENLVIANNGYSGIFVRADSKHVFRNSTIVGNGFSGSGRTGAGIHLGGANLTLENCIVAYSKTGLHHDGDPPQLTVRNSAFYNPGGQQIAWSDASGTTPAPRLDQNGNMTLDPLFVDRAAGNYELAANSPGVDAGRGVLAPTVDILGRPRYDDQGMPNVGTGFPSYVDLGAYERQADTAAVDLAVAFVSGPYSLVVSPSATIDVQWKVTNVGSVATSANWQDAFYLSDDPYFGQDLFLATVDHVGGLAAGAEYVRSTSLIVPQTSGPKYLLVRTNAGGALAEPNLRDNMAVAAAVLAVDVPVLTVGDSQRGSIAVGEWDNFRFEGEPGRTVLFSLDGESGALGLYVRRGLPPTVSDFDAAGNLANQSQQQSRLVDPAADAYYVGIFCPGTSAGSYTLTASLTSLAIRQVVPSTVGSAGRATIKIVGDSFHANAHVQLIAPDRRILEGEEYWQDSATLFVTFDLGAAGASPGGYDVVVTNPGPEVVSSPARVAVTEGGTGVLEAHLDVPGLSRPGRIIDLRVEYANLGTIDVPSPILRFNCNAEDLAWQLPGDNRWTKAGEFQILGRSSDGPATVLRPGQTESIVVRASLPFREDQFHITLSSMGTEGTDGSDASIDWEDLRRTIRPASISLAQWDPICAQLRLQIGETWGNYASAIRQTAEQLSAIGIREYLISALFAVELNWAITHATGSKSASIVPLGLSGAGFDNAAADRNTTDEDRLHHLWILVVGGSFDCDATTYVAGDAEMEVTGVGDVTGIAPLPEIFTCEAIGNPGWALADLLVLPTENFSTSSYVDLDQIIVRITGEMPTDRDAAFYVVFEPKDQKDPDNPDKEEDAKDTRTVTSYTPEDKFGPGGYDAPATLGGSESRYVTAGQTMDYRIEFWNKPDAPVPTQDAVIEDTLDPSKFDLSTLEFTRFGFLKWDQLFAGGQAIKTRIDLRPEMNLAVDVQATFDPQSGKMRWWFHCVDPLTGDYPEDPMAGFLPPYNSETGFEIGWIEYRVQPKAGLPSGTQIPNQAFVEFDFAGDLTQHPAPKERPWINTIDAGAPASSVSELPRVNLTVDFVVSWTGQDDAGGSGVGTYDVFVSDDGGVWNKWQDRTSQTSASFSGQPGHTYRFYSVARDNVGWEEAAVATGIFDTLTTVTQFPWQNPLERCDVDGQDGVGAQDVLLVINYINNHPGANALPPSPTVPPPFYNVNGDDAISPTDVLLVINYINSHIAGAGEGADTGATANTAAVVPEAESPAKSTTPAGALDAYGLASGRQSGLAAWPYLPLSRLTAWDSVTSPHVNHHASGTLSSAGADSRNVGRDGERRYGERRMATQRVRQMIEVADLDDSELDSALTAIVDDIAAQWSK